MLDLFERSKWGGTEAFYGISKLIFIQKLSHFEVRDFSRISYKKWTKIKILRYLTPNVSAPLIFVQISRNLHQMTTPYRGPKLRRLYWKFWKFAILCHYFMKNDLKIAKLKLYFVQKWHKINNFQNSRKVSLNLVPYMGWSSGANFS